jgi:GDPmannose 4,6-dehydratase
LSKRRVIIVGHQGQDGRLLSQRLRQRGDLILGIGKRSIDVDAGMTTIDECRVDQPETVHHTIRAVQPDEVYYLAAYHASSQGASGLDLHDDYLASITVNFLGLLHFLEAIRLQHPATRLFFASSSLIFGNSPIETPQCETTPAMPEEPYGLCKKLAGEVCRDYRERHGIFASVGILFNHESVYRPPTFLSMRIIRGAIAALRGSEEKLVVGNLDATVDWGYAPDFVDAFPQILGLNQPDDFVIATGVSHTVRDFLAAAFGHVGLDWNDHVVQQPSVLVRHRTGRVGNSAKLQRLTGWRPTLTFKKMVAMLVDQVTLETGRE